MDNTLNMDVQQKRLIRVGSRNSQLALIQTNHVIERLKQLNPEFEFEVTTMMTLGDKILNISLPKIGEKSVFTRELEDALAKKTVDIIVHSLKDLPTSLPNGMGIGAILEREDPRDALVLREDLKGHTLETLPSGAVIGTSSLRRTAQLAKSFPHLKVIDIRGNLNTRLSKLDRKFESSKITANKDCEYSALILAAAGLTRMGWTDRISQVLPCSTLMYAVGQGALAVECRSDDDDILRILSALSDRATYCRALAERSFLKTLGGGCSAPVAVSTSLKKYTDGSSKGLKLKISGAVWSLDGKQTVEDNSDCVFVNYNESTSPPRKHKLNEEEINEAKKPKSMHDLLQSPLGNCEDLSNDSLAQGERCAKDTSNKDGKNCCVRNKSAIDIESLINIHGKLFISCPYSSQNGMCPIDLPVGQDFMAKCPYFDPDKDSANELIGFENPSTSERVDISQCPFMSSQMAGVSKKEVSDLTVKSDTCQNNLYCGLTRHFDIAIDIIDKCENLGKELAQSLIKLGALEIMKITQDYIHSFHAVPKKE